MKLHNYRDKDNKKRVVLLDEDGVPIEEVSDFLKYQQNIGKAPNTVLTYGRCLKPWYEYLEEKGLDALSIDKVKNQLSLFSGYGSYLRKQGNSEATISLRLAAVFLFYEYLRTDGVIEFQLYDKLRHEYIKHNKGMLGEMHRGGHNTIDMGKIFHPSSQKQLVIEYLTRDDYNKLIGACRNVRDKVLIGLMFECGLRVGEVLGMHISDIRVEDNHVVVTPRQDNENDAFVKRQAGRIVTCSDDLARWIEHLLVADDYLDMDSDYLFVVLEGKNKGRPLTYNAVYQNLQKVAGRAGVKFHPHMGRHGFGMERLNDGGYRLEEVAQAMGHGSLESTKRYAKYTEEHMNDVSRKFYEERKLINGDNNDKD